MIADRCSPPLTQDGAAPFQVAGITKWYGDQRALADVSFDIRRGEILGLIGPNGSGKTTLLESVAGLLPVDAGSVLWQRSSLPQHRRRDVVFYSAGWCAAVGRSACHPRSGIFRIRIWPAAAELDEVTRSVGLEEVLGKYVCRIVEGLRASLDAGTGIADTTSGAADGRAF